MEDLQVNTCSPAPGKHLVLVLKVRSPSTQGNDLFSSQLRKIIHHNHTAFKLGFVLLNETHVQRFPPALMAWKCRSSP